jgi:hypothetical protein
MAELRIPIIVENKGKKAFGDTNKSVSALDKGVKRLGASLAATFGAQQLLKFAKNATKAFIEDEQAATRLAQSVKNLGLAFETPRIEEFISQLSRASGVTDDQLRPSMQKLLQTTGSVTKSTALLTQALDISRGSGVDFETVVNDLSMAYVGQTRGLRKYSLGLSQAELKTMSFADVQERLAKQFTGSNAAFLETYAGKMTILTTAAGEASETIGKGLVESLSILAGEGNTVQPIADSMQDLATYVSDVITGLATMIAEFKKLPGVNKYITEIFPAYLRNTPFGAILEGIRKFAPKTTPGMGGYPSSALGGTFIDPNEAARKAAEAAAVKRAKELAALQKKTLDTQKKSLALQKASKTLNLDAIGIEAALKGKISETDRLSLLLQKSLLEGNETLATSLSDQLSAAVKRNNDLQAALLATPEAPNPYRNWKVPEMGPLGGLSAGVIAGVNPSQVFPELAPVVPVAPPAFNVPQYAPDSLTQYGPLGGLAAGVIAGVNPTPTINIKVEVAGEDVAAVITQQQTNDSLSGSFNTVNRTNRFAAAGFIPA